MSINIVKCMRSLIFKLKLIVNVCLIHTFLSSCSIVFQVIANRLVRSCLVGSPSPDIMI